MVCIVAPARAQYTVNWYTIDGGGVSQASGTPYALWGTIGQPDAGVMAGGVYSLKGGFWRSGSSLVAVDDDKAAGTPLAFRLHAGSPNPLVRSTVVALDLPTARHVQLRIYDASGRVARSLVEGSLPAGHHQRTWDGADDGGHPVAAGVYFIRCDSESDRASQKIAVLR